MRRRKIPSLNALKAFEAAARHLSFKEAARELNVSQSAVSHQVKGLEESLGFSLFERGVRAVGLTPRGRRYYPVVRDAFDALAEGTERIFQRDSSGVITLQVYSTFTIRWLLPRLTRFHRQQGDIQVRLNTTQADADFERDDIHAAIMIGKPTEPTLRYDYLFDVELFPVCSPDFLLRFGEPVTPERLHEAQLLQVYPSPNDWRVWLEGQGLHTLDPDQGANLESYEVALGSAAQGLGVALGQQPYVARDLATGTLVEMFPDRRVRNPNRWYLAAPVDRAESPKVAFFREWLLSEVAQDSQLLCRPAGEADSG